MRTVFLSLLLLFFGALLLGCGKKKAGPNEPDGNNEQGGAPTETSKLPVYKGQKAGADKWGTFTVSKATTIAIGPTDASGYIDYAAALDERLRKDIRFDDNANVGIWQALGPNPTTGKVPAGLFDKLGLKPPPPATGDYFVDLKQYAPTGGPNVTNAALGALMKYSEKVWTSNDNATLHGWLKANEKPMALIAESVKKAQYYNPLIPEQDAKGSRGLFSSLLPGVDACAQVARAFACRAMLLLGHNQPAQAWQDLLTCHRLARHIGRGISLTEGYAGLAIDQLACRADLVFLSAGKPDANTLKTCVIDLAGLPPLPEMADKFDLGERFVFLETVMLTNRHGVAFLEARAKDMEEWPPAFTDEVLPGVDWNHALEKGNKLFDQFAAAMREPTRDARAKKLTEAEKEVAELKNSLKPDVAKETFQPLPKRSAAIGDMLIAFQFPYQRHGRDARKAMDARDIAEQVYESTVVAFACVWYQRQKGKFPAKLADIAPTYLREVPKDLFSGKELAYGSGEFSFEILSVGPNGINEGGQGSPIAGMGDDIVIRFPPPPKGP